MMFVLLVVTLFWVAPLALASLISLAATLSPRARAVVRHHLFGEDLVRAPARGAAAGSPGPFAERRG